MSVPLLLDDPHLLVDATDSPALSFAREPVELSLGQREGPLLFDRVLGREHEERVAEADA